MIKHHQLSRVAMATAVFLLFPAMGLAQGASRSVDASTYRTAPAIGLPFQPTGEQIIRAFAQGAAGNCTSIAAIKAAMLAFGRRPIFASVKSDSTGDVVVMRDGPSEYRVSSAEIAAAQTLSRFEPSDTMLTRYANYLFAVMVKRYQVEALQNGNRLSFEEAAEELNEGQNWRRGPYWLGLSDFVITGPNSKLPWVAGAGRFLRDQEAGIAKRANHTWFVTRGVHDRRGEPGDAFPLMSGAIALDVARIRSTIPEETA